MPLFDSAIHIVNAMLIWIFGFFVVYYFIKKLNIKLGVGCAIYIWHTLFCFFYIYFIYLNGGDAVGYYRRTLNNDFSFGFGTPAVSVVAWPFVHLLNLSFVGVNLAFNIFGTIGLLAFYASLKVATFDKSNNIKLVALLIIFLPSVSFWSSAIGKDSLSFMAAGLALWAAVDFKTRIKTLFFSIFIMLLVRPHMAAAMAVAFGAALFFSGGISNKLKLFVGPVVLLSLVLMIPFAMSYSGLESGGVNDVSEFLAERQGHNLSGGGGVDISSMAFPVKIFSYLFRPMPYEAHSIFSFAAAIDNVILLVVCFFGLKSWLLKVNGVGVRGVSNSFLFFYSLISLVILSLTTANLGISVRQKWMFMPMLVFLWLSFCQVRRKV